MDIMKTTEGMIEKRRNLFKENYLPKGSVM